MRVALGTAKPDTRRETGHCSSPIFVHNCLIFGVFLAVSALFAIPDNIAADSQIV
jgi:hypothetical protein